MASLDNETFEITCPSCKKSVKEKFKNIKGDLKCSCGAIFDTKEVEKARNSINKKLKGLDKLMNKTINIKI